MNCSCKALTDVNIKVAHWVAFDHAFLRLCGILIRFVSWCYAIVVANTEEHRASDFQYALPRCATHNLQRKSCGYFVLKPLDRKSVV